MAKAHLEMAFEELIEQHLLSNGWVQGSPHDYNRPLGLDTGQLFTFIGATQPDAWAKYVSFKGDSDKAQQDLAKRLSSELDARGAIDVLRRGVKDTGVTFDLAYFAPAHDLTPELRDKYDANRVTVTRQAPVSESHPLDTVDLLMSVNGIPVATAELKRQSAGQNIDHAMKQYRTDREAKDLLFRARSVVHFAVDDDSVYMTTQLAGQDTVFLPFNLGSDGAGQDGGKGNPLNPTGYRTSYLWEQVWRRDNWLDLLGSFVHVEAVLDKSGKKTGKKVTIFPRFHQWDAVTKLLSSSCAEGPGHNKLIQHSAGSGKSNTIAWLAHRLSRLHTAGSDGLLGDGAKESGLGPNTPVFDKVVIITDRVVLDRQLQDTVAGFEHTPGMIETIGDGKTSQHLRAALEGQKARIIVTTLQKFPVVAESATNLAGTRFAVIVDEAHSSQSGEAAKDLKKVLSGMTGDAALVAAEVAESSGPVEKDAEDQLADSVLAQSVAARGKQKNLTFFAFTATPKAKTLELFGESYIAPDGDSKRKAFHLYSMRQAVEEGFILDVLANYTTYKTYYRLANGLAPSDDPELPKGKAASALARYVSLHPTNLAQKAEIIVEHFRAHTQNKIGGRAKAMVVTRSRLHAVRYQQVITKHIADKGYRDLHALVSFSGTVIDPDLTGVEYTEPGMNKDWRTGKSISETRLPERFDSDDYQVLVVAEKYQTGFDQPLLHTMYVDKLLTGVNAVQTLSRLNRTTPGKQDTFILDFTNDAEDIQDAFDPYFTQTTASPTDPNLLYTLQQRIEGANVIDPLEMKTGVAAILATGSQASAVLNAAIDPAVERWMSMPDEDEQELFRTALRDFVRAYAFLAQIVPYGDAEMESLYYYGKYLLTRLPKVADDSGAVDVADKVTLTHLRTDLIADQESISLSTGDVESLVAISGGGAGRQHEEPLEALSALIAALNERFGMDLTEADRIWFEQQEAHLVEDENVQAAARNNDLDQFRVFVEPVIEDKIIDRHEANDVLFQAFFDKPDFRELLLKMLVENSYKRIRDEHGRAG